MLTIKHWIHVCEVFFLLAHKQHFETPPGPQLHLFTSVGTAPAVWKGQWPFWQSWPMVKITLQKNPTIIQIKPLFLLLVISSWSRPSHTPQKLCCHNKGQCRHRTSRDQKSLNQHCYQRNNNQRGCSGFRNRWQDLQYPCAPAKCWR